jgi:1A family penicillin-binding protein
VKIGKRTNPLIRTVSAWPVTPEGLSPLGLIGRVLLVPVVILVCSLLVAAGLFPAIGGAGQAVKLFEDKLLGGESTDLSLPAFPIRSTIYAADGSVLATVADFNRLIVSLDDVSKYARDAVLAIEDNGFYTHGPINFFSIMRAAIANLRAGKVVQGGSTISQQLVKQTETGAEQTFQRKFQEAQDAIRLERTYTKDQILEAYLNEIYLGHGAYGIGSAAEYYFAKTAANLTLAQSATLAALISSPVYYDPINHADIALAQRNIVLHQMLDLGWVTTEEYQRAVSTPIRLSDKKRSVNTAGPEPYFVQYVKDLILHPSKSNPQYADFIKAFGKTYDDRKRLLFQGGLQIYTTLNPTWQQSAAGTVTKRLPSPGKQPPANPEAAVISIVPQTGAITTMYGGPSFESSQFNLATQSQRTAGSAFKAFTLTAAFEQGMPIGKEYDTSPPVVIPTAKCPDPSGAWHPANAEPGEGGVINMTRATASSVNTYFAQLIADVGAQNVSDTAVAMGVQSYARDAFVSVPPVCAITLGTVVVNPLSMTSGYSTLANNGTHCYPFAIRKVVSGTGRSIFKVTPSCEQVVDPHIAAQVTGLLEGVVTGGTGTAAQLGSRPVAGKTGTGQDYQDAWFIGYVPQLVTGVWVGYPNEVPMRDLPVLGGANAFGGTIAAPIWHDYMVTAVSGMAVKGFPQAPGGATGTVPDVTGMKQDDAVKTLTDAKWTPIVKEAASIEPAGTVFDQDPKGGAKAPLGSAVTIMVSNGKAPKVLVPNVVGATEADATKTLETVGFVVSVVYVPVSDVTQVGIVQSQLPVAGSTYKAGTTVTIFVGQLEPSPSPSPSPTPSGQPP